MFGERAVKFCVIKRPVDMLDWQFHRRYSRCSRDQQWLHHPFPKPLLPSCLHWNRRHKNLRHLKCWLSPGDGVPDICVATSRWSAFGIRLSVISWHGWGTTRWRQSRQQPYTRSSFAIRMKTHSCMSPLNLQGEIVKLRVWNNKPLGWQKLQNATEIHTCL